MKPYYQDSAVTIYHGDCREIVPVLGKFDLLLTDPPYGLGDKLQGGTWGIKAGKALAWDVPHGDLKVYIHSSNNAIIWGGNYFDLPASRCWLAWIKRDAVPTVANVDLAWTNHDAPSRYFDTTIARTNSERCEHPTIKPLRLMSWCILQSDLISRTLSQTILDPFAGSGTTGRAAKDLGRKATLIEREERYCEIAAKRMHQEVFAL